MSFIQQVLCAFCDRDHWIQSSEQDKCDSRSWDYSIVENMELNKQINVNRGKSNDSSKIRCSGESSQGSDI